MELFLVSLQSFWTTIGIIAVLGAQNIVVLKYALRREHLLIITITPIFFDLLISSLGIIFFTTLSTKMPFLIDYFAWLGIIFLVLYGIRCFYMMFKDEKIDINENQESKKKTSWKKAFLTLSAVTLLNPHVYVDLVLLLGSISTKFPGEKKFAFWLGIMTASTFWFSFLNISGKLLLPFFKNPITWKILNFIFGVIMWYLAYTLLDFNPTNLLLSK